MEENYIERLDYFLYLPAFFLSYLLIPCAHIRLFYCAHSHKSLLLFYCRRRSFVPAGILLRWWFILVLLHRVHSFSFHFIFMGWQCRYVYTATHCLYGFYFGSANVFLSAVREGPHTHKHSHTRTQPHTPRKNETKWMQNANGNVKIWWLGLWHD